jgi:ADP-heptose:LPS heptosyltransferase
LKGVIDLRERLNLRDLIRLVYHAEGVLCPVTLLMHLAAAVETKPSARKSRPCVVVAGGREAPHWAAYPTHQFLHTVGTLSCCAEGGCWKVRTVPLGDGDYRDAKKYLCVDVVNGLPRCMDMITPEHVIGSIELFLQWPQREIADETRVARLSTPACVGGKRTTEPSFSELGVSGSASETTNHA